MMTYSDQTYDLRIELDTKDCELTADEIQRMERALDPLRKPVEKFPVRSLYVTIEHHERTRDYRVKAVLKLPGATLATGDLEPEHYSAFERCVRKLVRKVVAYEDDLENAEDRSKHLKGTRHDLTPLNNVDMAAVRRAVEQSDYSEFRRQTAMYEEPLRKRIGRWVQRYPEIDAQLGERFSLADAVEEVFLNAFERFDSRSDAVPFGTWLEHLIDPSIKILSRDTIAELDNISFARSLHGEE